MAIRENPKDPLQSRFATSFLTTYSSSVTIVQAIRKGYERSPDLLLRQWALWLRGLGCGVVIGSVAATNAHSELSQSAFEELEMVINLFEKVSTHSVAKNGLPILRRLYDKAKRIRGLVQETLAYVKTEEVDEALKMIGGTKRSVRQMRRSFSSSATGNSIALPLRPPQMTPDTTTFLSSQKKDELTSGTLAMESLRYDAPWEAQVPTDNRSSSNFPVAMGSNAAGDATLMEPAYLATSETDMNANMNLDNLEFSYGGAQHPYDDLFFDTQWFQQTGNTDETIEDAWRMILEDTDLIGTGMTGTTFQF